MESVENKKLIDEKKKKHRTEIALAKRHEKQKLEALAQQRKQKAEELEQVAKKRAAENAVKMAAETQKRKEQDDQRALEKLHQDEMRRITTGSAGNG